MRAIYFATGLTALIATASTNASPIELGLNNPKLIPVSGSGVPPNIIGHVRGVECRATPVGPTLSWPPASLTSSGKPTHDFLVTFVDPAGSGKYYSFIIPGTEGSIEYDFKGASQRKTYVGINVFKVTARGSEYLYAPFNARGAMYRNLNGILSCSGPLLLIK